MLAKSSILGYIVLRFRKKCHDRHHAGAQALASTHVHLDDHCCLEVILMIGKARDLQQVADSILSLRGVKNGKLVLTSGGN